MYVLLLNGPKADIVGDEMVVSREDSTDLTDGDGRADDRIEANKQLSRSPDVELRMCSLRGLIMLLRVVAVLHFAHGTIQVL